MVHPELLNFAISMKVFYFCSLFLILSIAVLAQDESWDPELTEIWEPVPAVIEPGKDASPPSDAIILLGPETDLVEWEHNDGSEVCWKWENGVLTVKKNTGGIQTKRVFADVQLHVEWRTPKKIEGDGQGRGNSGVFLQSNYEVQVLDSYQNKTYPNGQAGSIYKQHIPMVNASRGPGEWQAYDIIFNAPVFAEEGDLVKPAYLTVFHNGVLIQNHVDVKGKTTYRGLPKYHVHGKLPIMLQDHDNPVSYRNIWVREL